MATKAKNENKPVDFAHFNFKKCGEVNPYLNEAVFTVSDDAWRLYIPKLDIEFTDKPTILRIIHSGLRSIVSDYNANKGDAVPENIVTQLTVWRESGLYLTPKEKEKASKPAVIKSGKTVKSQYTQADIASALRATLGADDSRAKLVEGLKDELFLTFMEKRSGESYMVDAIAFLKKQDEILAEKEKRELEEQLAALGL